MKKGFLISIVLLACASSILWGQQRPLGHEDVLKWKRITETKLANDGSFVVYKTQPWKGDTKVYITGTNGQEIASFEFANSINITPNSKHVVFTMQAPLDSIRQLKLKKVKKDKMPKNKLALYSMDSKTVDLIENLKSYKLPKNWSGYVAYQVESGKKEEAKGDESKDEKKERKSGEPLYVRELDSKATQKIPNVSQYYFAEDEPILVYFTHRDNGDFSAGLHMIDLTTGSQNQILSGKFDLKQFMLNKDGSKLAFLAAPEDKRVKKKEYGVYFWDGSGQAQVILDSGDEQIPTDWEISTNGRLLFSENNNRLFIGIAPIRPEKDTTVLDEERPVVDIWHWNEPILQTRQINQKKSRLRKSYLTVIHLDTRKLVQLENEQYTGISLLDEGNADQAIAWSNLPYAVQGMWEGSPGHNDFYLVDLQTGRSELIKTDCRARPMVSTNGKYLYWYQAIDTTWHTYKLNSRQEFVITTQETIQCARELNDVPNLPGSYQTAGWLENDDALLIYDRYDIWKVDPENREDAVNLTQNGRESKINYRLIRFDTDRDRGSIAPKGIKFSELHYLTGHNEVSRHDGFYSIKFTKGKTPTELLVGPFKLSGLQKAKDSHDVLYTKEDFNTFPNIIGSNLKFKTHTQLSDANPQQEEFIWGTAELVSWTSLDGRKLEGTLHKPANFDPGKKYPMIVNFYEKSSQGLFGHRIPERHRSTVDYHYYTSNGYLVFNPDVYYKEGYPGEDAFNCVMPGVTALIAKGFVDEDRIGAQGHSWGGYQVAYLATRTNLFAAIESGAPVVNMFSAYGGIRWGSGLNRSFQYEHTQSRIGKSIWESPLRFIENSPIFTMDKVQTPILIMHNDDDGAVPWYQGIEYFIALRRLGKPAWLLNYNNADHWPTRIEDKHDFQIRLAQFFDHYLKGKPMPKWMKDGIPAIDKGIEMGY